MAESRWQRFAHNLSEIGGPTSTADRICELFRIALDGAASSFAVVVNHSYTAFAHSGDSALVLDETQFQLGEGPVFDVQHSSTPILVDDALSHSTLESWPAFSPVLESQNIRSLATFPLRVGVENIGSLTVYRERSGILTADQYADGLVAVGFAVAEVVNSRAGVAMEPGGLDLEHARSGNSYLQLAAGMVAEALGVSIVEALVRIRSHAFAEDLPVTEIAQRITRRELMLDA